MTRRKNKFLCAVLVLCLGVGGTAVEAKDSSQKKNTEKWDEAVHTPYGKYPETVTYTLGKISGANNSNLPLGETYEDNAYTQYLKKMLNIQNQDIFEMEDGTSYEQAIEMAIEDNDIPDILVVKGRENLKKLVSRDLVEDLSAVYEECATDRIIEMYESYGEDLLDSAIFDGKLYAFPDKPYLLTGQTQRKTLESYKNWQYVVVRKGYEHPEIIGKYVSVLFDYTRYEDRNASDINDYFSLNVDPTARPLNINVDYWDGLYRTTENIQAALDGALHIQELTGIEKAYYQTCKSYMNETLTTVNGWAAYASRIQAVSLLAESGRGTRSLSMGDADGEIPQYLQKLETETFLQIICGEKPVEYFDQFVEEWYESGGESLTRQVQEGYSGT